MLQVKAALAFIRVAWPYATIAALILALMLTRETLWREKARSAGIQSAYNDFAARTRLASKTALADDLANVVRVTGEQVAITNNVETDYAAKIDALRADYDNRLRAESAERTSRVAAADLPSPSAAACRTDEAPRQAQVLPLKDALIASEQAEQLVALQDWARRQAAVRVD